MKLEGASTIVTGAAGGIGAALADRFLRDGARVVITDLDAQRLESTRAKLDQQHVGRVLAVAGDVADTATIQSVIDCAASNFGPVDLYAANAGIGLGAGMDSTDADWESSWNVNVMAHVRAAKLLIPGWLERGRGHFLATASAAGLVTQLGSPTYAVTKHAAVAFAEWLSVTYGSRGIGVSCLCPMGVNTAMLHPDVPEDANFVGSRAVTEAGNVLEPHEVADIVAAGLQTDQFLILPHPEVLEFYRRKGSDYDRWIRGMRRYQDTLNQEGL